MNKKYEMALVIFFLLNSISMWVFWTKYLSDFTEQNILFSQNVTPFVVTHIVSEYSIGIFTLIACILLFKKSNAFNVIWYFALGMHFYAALQATGWAFSNKIYPIFGMLILNIFLVLSYLMVSIKKQNFIRAILPEDLRYPGQTKQDFSAIASK